MKFKLNDIDISCDIQGHSEYGPDYVMLEKDDDLTKDLPWHKTGYIVAPFHKKDEL